MNNLKNFNIGSIELKYGNTVIYKETELNKSLYDEGFSITPNGVQLVSTKPISEMIGSNKFDFYGRRPYIK